MKQATQSINKEISVSFLFKAIICGVTVDYNRINYHITNGALKDE